MECSTTELRQHARIRESAETAPTGGPILATRLPLVQAREQPARHPKRLNSARPTGSGLLWPDAADPVPDLTSKTCARHHGDRRQGSVTGEYFRKTTAPCAGSAKSWPRSRIGDCRRAEHDITGPRRREARRIRNGSMMTDDGDQADGRPGHLAKKDARRDRLKEALRENLKRRKSQTRGRGDIAPAPSHGEIAAPHDGGGDEKPGE